jgi:hypothetical protein
MSDPQSLSIVVVMMGRPIDQAVCRMTLAASLDATLRPHVFDETKLKMMAVASSQFGFENTSVNDDKFSKDTTHRS